MLKFYNSKTLLLRSIGWTIDEIEATTAMVRAINIVVAF